MNYKKKIRVFFDNYFKKGYANQQLIYDSHKLKNLFPNGFFYPETDWSLSSSFIVDALNTILIKDSKFIVEFGSGISTFYIAKLLQVYNLKTKFISIESNLDWANKQRNWLKCQNLDNFVTIIDAPLTNVSSVNSYKSQRTWYSEKILYDILTNLPPIDLVLVDGPFGESSPYSRYSAVPFLKDFLAEDFTIFLDDTIRKQEYEISQVWSDQILIKPLYNERYCKFSKSNFFESNPKNLN
ncbi:class I SAM-dependent methyltransferase [Croceibacter atlanticus]|uniref:class I SAM-dependent methyltransferase n=1 Tax=Croceibacter atlanticus TaxID=313588 RepID=UPI0024B9EB19|nr:class I SAM-dependent methyltransferase [Croceibacter atlanticus]WSP33512.1 class I SAM-dependent methyltransferase [Croceibacter atlanticus]